MADEQVRLEQGMLKIAKAYKMAERAARGMLKAFGEEVDAHAKVTQGIAKQLTLDEKLTKKLREKYRISGDVIEALKAQGLAQSEIVTVIQKTIKQ